MAAAGTVLPNDLIWSEGMPQWTAGGAVSGLFAGGRPPPGVIPSISYYATAAPPITYAGFWLRFVAALVDGILLTIVCLIFDAA